jgi:hypothetical protein
VSRIADGSKKRSERARIHEVGGRGP